MDLGELFIVDSGPGEASFIVAAKAKSFVCQVRKPLRPSLRPPLRPPARPPGRPSVRVVWCGAACLEV